MVHIEADQSVPQNEDFLVIAGGDYENTALVEVYRAGDPDKISWCAFQAFFIANGYNFGEE